MSYDILNRNGIEITQNMGEWTRLGEKYNLPPEEIGLIDFNRTGVRLDGHEVQIGFRTRFNGSLLYPNDWSWFALPVRSAADTNFHIGNGMVYFKNVQIGFVDKPILDTCDTSYQRGPRLLNLNSRSRSNCAGCKACVHNDKNLYDDTVIRDKHELKTEQDIEKFFQMKEREGVKISNLDQIAVVTGLFSSGTETLQHLKDVHKVATKYGFHGELMYFGCQLMNARVLREFAKLGKTAIVFAIDNFTEREAKLSRIKSNLMLKDFYESMYIARNYGIETTFAYIVGVDDLLAVSTHFSYFSNVCTRFPVVNIFQIQTNLQAQALHEDAKNLEYYVQARLAIEKVFKDSGMYPRRWENYRPLWYREFDHKLLNVKPYS